MLVLLAVISLAVSACGAAQKEVAAPGTTVGTEVDIPLPQRILDLPFTDSTGATVHLSDFADHVVVLMPSMTLCQETCPLDTSQLVSVMHQANDGPLDATDSVVYLWVTVDPWRDDPAQLTAYRRQWAAADELPNWHLLTGKPAAVHALWKQLGVFVKKTKGDDDGVVRNWRTGAVLTFDVQHSDEVFFIDGDGHERFILEGMPTFASTPSLPKKLAAFLSDEGRKNEGFKHGWTIPGAESVLSWLLDRPLPSASASANSG